MVKVNEGGGPDEMFEGSKSIIWAPHPDDEIIGCYEVLMRDNPAIIYSGDIENARREEALKLREHVPIGPQLFLMTVPPSLMLKSNTFYFPDPVEEFHPQHREVGFMGEQIARAGYNVIFYSVNMQAKYIHRSPDAQAKKELLDKVYPSQKDLWKYDNKYFLFEGYCKWIF